jgi:hypothetical protein
MYGKHQPLFEEIEKIIKTAPALAEGGREWFDKSDAMTDYFHTAFYIDLDVGSYDKPYVYNGKKSEYDPNGLPVNFTDRYHQEVA